jgi:hypothetical protein
MRRILGGRVEVKHGGGEGNDVDPEGLEADVEGVEVWPCLAARGSHMRNPTWSRVPMPPNSTLAHSGYKVTTMIHTI